MATRFGHVTPSKADLERFESKIDKNFKDNHWYVPGYAVSVGGRSFTTATAAWLLYRGPLEPTERVIRECEFPMCCNPAHLRKKPVTYSRMGQKIHLRYREP